MATLNTLRTKFGIVLSAVIAFALLAFIFSLKAEMGFGGNDPQVAEINGQAITYTEYQTEYQGIKSQSGANESTEEQITMLSNAAMQSLLSKYLLTPGFQQLGVAVSESERQAMINGQIPTQAFYNAFRDPSTGAYNTFAVSQFLMQSAGNPEAESAWAFINSQARMEREGSEYMALVRGGVYVNALEVAQAEAAANKTFKGRWAGKRYSELADSLFKVSDSEIKAYYNAHKEMYKQVPLRKVSYAMFNITPTADDRLAIETEAKKAGEELAAAENIRTYIRENRNGSVANNFVTEAQLSTAEGDALAEGKQYGPTLSNNTWRMSRAVETVMAPDSVGIRLIALPGSQRAVADSLKLALSKAKAGDGSFAKAAAEFSVDQQSAQAGGEYGRFPYAAFTGELATALATAKEGKIVEVASGDIIQLIEPFNVGKSTKHYMVASIEYPVVASQATIRKAHSDAGSFAVEATKSEANFKAAADKAAVSVKNATLRRGERTVQGIADSREVARWIYGAEVGALSEIFKVESGYVVAMLTAIDDADYQSVESVKAAIRTQILNQKKFDAIAKEMQGSTFEEQSKSLGESNGTFEDVNFGSFYINGLGVEPRVIGAISATEATGKVSAAIKGNSGLYIFEVEAIAEAEEPTTAEAAKVRAQATAENMVQQVTFPAIEMISNIKDLRGRYF